MENPKYCTLLFLVPPLLLAPFLTGPVLHDEVNTTVEPNGFLYNSDVELEGRDETSMSALTSLSHSVGSDLFIPFSVGSSILVFAVLIQIALFFKLKKCVDVKEAPLPPEELAQYGTTRWRMYILFLSCCVIGSYQGMELTVNIF